MAHVRGYGAGHIVPVVAVIVAEVRAIANIQTAGLVLYGGRSQVHQRLDAAVVWIAEEGGDVRIGGSAVEGRNAAVRGAVVAEVFVAERDLRLFSGLEGEGWADAVALQIDVLPEAIGVFVHAVQPEGYSIVQWLVQIGGEAFVAERAALQGYFAERREIG